MSGDVSHNGVHAWKEASRAVEYATYYPREIIVLGKVKLWGEVVEHECGYRAEYGKVCEINQVIYSGGLPVGALNGMLESLKRKYLDAT